MWINSRQVIAWAIEAGLLWRLPKTAGKYAGRLCVGPGRWPKLKEYNRHGKMITRLPAKRIRAMYLLPAPDAKDVYQAGQNTYTSPSLHYDVQDMAIPEFPYRTGMIYLAYHAVLKPDMRQRLAYLFPSKDQDKAFRKWLEWENVARLTGAIPSDTCGAPEEHLVWTEKGTRRELRGCSVRTNGKYCAVHQAWEEHRDRLSYELLQEGRRQVLLQLAARAGHGS